MPAREVLVRAVQPSLRLDRSQLAPGTALHCAVGVALPLVIGLAAGHARWGVAAAAGALSVGFASYQGTYATRALAMIFTSLAMGLSTFVGALVAPSATAAALTTGVWAAAAGMLSALGPAATGTSLQAVVALLVVAQLHLSVPQGLVQAALVIAGGLTQLTLLVLVWPLRRFRAERRALAALFDCLADYGAGLGAAELGPPSPQPFDAARALLGVPLTVMRGVRFAFRLLDDEGESLRVRLAALARDRARLGEAAGVADGAPARARAAAAAAAVDAIGTGVSAIAREIAAAVAEARVPYGGGPVDGARGVATWTALDDARRTLAALGEAAHESGDPFDAPLAALLESTQRLVAALFGHLRAAERIARMPVTGVDAEPAAWPSLGRRLVTPLAESWRQLAANLTLRSVTCRHALRLGVTVVAAVLVERVIGLHHGYWLPLTALIVLKPDFSSTLTRGLGRMAGTLAGVGLASLVLMAHPGQPLLVALTLVAAWGGYLLFNVNYALFSLCITDFVVFLIALSGVVTVSVAVDRLLATVLGGVFAFIAYAVWPTWEGARANRRFAGLVAAQARYGAAVLGAFAEPARADARVVAAARDAARVERVNAEAAVDRMLAEPAYPQRLATETAIGLLKAARRFALAALSLQARLPRPDEPGLPLAAARAAWIAATLARVAAALDAGDIAAHRPSGEPPPPPFAPPPALRRGAADAPLVVAAESELMLDSAAAMAALVLPDDERR